jgi:hypothetical protein
MRFHYPFAGTGPILGVGLCRIDPGNASGASRGSGDWHFRVMAGLVPLDANFTRSRRRFSWPGSGWRTMTGNHNRSAGQASRHELGLIEFQYPGVAGRIPGLVATDSAATDGHHEGGHDE